MILKMNNTVSSLVVLFACLLLPSRSALCNPSDSASDSCRAFFVDPANGDYRIAPDSPARKLRTDGSPVGAKSLWN